MTAAQMIPKRVAGKEPVGSFGKVLYIIGRPLLKRLKNPVSNGPFYYLHSSCPRLQISTFEKTAVFTRVFHVISGLALVSAEPRLSLALVSAEPRLRVITTSTSM